MLQGCQSIKDHVALPVPGPGAIVFTLAPHTQRLAHVLVSWQVLNNDPA